MSEVHNNRAPDRARRGLCLTAALATCLPGCTTPPPPQGRLDTEVLARLDAAVADAVAAGRTPGAVLRVEHAGAVYQRAIGRKALQPASEALQEDTVYDVASLTKVVVTAPLVMMLVEAGALDLDTPVRRLIPTFTSGDTITPRQLLTHTSGLPAGLPLEPEWSGAESAVALACSRTATHAPGSFFRYSDVNYILLGEIVQRLAGQPLAQTAQQRLFGPLGMADTGFHPLQRLPAGRIAPTERDAALGRPLRGEVHDPTARRMGGAAGHAGLFSTTADLALYARMLLAGGTLAGRRVLQPASVAAMTQTGTPVGLPERRGLGFDIDSSFSRARGSVYPVGSSCGHTGFTGCAMWLDIERQRFHVLLSNRVHPVAGETIVALYEQVGTLAALAAS